MTYSPLCSMPVWKTETKAILRKRSSVVKDIEDNMKKNKLLPGQCIAVDHYICSTKGRLFTSRGKTKNTDMYTEGAPSPAPSFPEESSFTPVASPSSSNGASPPAQHQREKTHLPQPQHQRELPKAQKREQSSSRLQQSRQTCKQSSMLRMDPSKTSYASIAALDSIEDTSLL